MKVLLIFIDGFGIGENNPEINPIVAGNTPTFDKLFNQKGSIMIPTDASQGVKGIPQSATGQTALLTGVNASQIIGRHVSGFPGPRLRQIIAEKNILKQLKIKGKKVTFANAYTEEYVEAYYNGKIKGSVTTVCVDTACISFRYAHHIPFGQAVYQEFTNSQLIKMGLDLPELEPEEAAKNLIKIANDHDFTLYEFFQTDFAGHSQDMSLALPIIERLDRFLGQILLDLNFEDTLLVISSDHGNVEDLSVLQHTCNLVPTFLIGAKKEIMAKKIKGLSDITPAIINLFDEETL